MNDDTTKKQVEDVYNAMVDVITQEISNGGEVSLRGFGTFKSYLRKSIQAYNFAENQPMTLPPKHHINFVAGKRLKKSKESGGGN